MKLGIYEKAINSKFSWREKIKLAKEAGFDFIEFSIDESDKKLERLSWPDKKINDLKQILIEENFYFNSMALSSLRKYPFGSHDINIRKKSIEILEKAIILAKKLGIRNVQLAGYDVYYEESDNETINWFIEGCKKAAMLAQRYSVMLSFEVMDTEFMGTVSRCLEYLDKINSPWLTIYPDIGNIYQWTNDLENEFEKGKSKITGIHFKDTKPGAFKEVPWGEGTVDFQRVMNILKNINYNGPFLIEMWSKNNEDETMAQNLEKLQQAIKFYKKFEY